MPLKVVNIDSAKETITVNHPNWSCDMDHVLNWNEALRLAVDLVYAVAELADRTKNDYFTDFLMYQHKP